MGLKLYHCERARSMRPLWTLEEMGIDYELITMPFLLGTFIRNIWRLILLALFPHS